MNFVVVNTSIDETFAPVQLVTAMLHPHRNLENIPHVSNDYEEKIFTPGSTEYLDNYLLEDVVCNSSPDDEFSNKQRDYLCTEGILTDMGKPIVNRLKYVIYNNENKYSFTDSIIGVFYNRVPSLDKESLKMALTSLKYRMTKYNIDKYKKEIIKSIGMIYEDFQDMGEFSTVSKIFNEVFNDTDYNLILFKFDPMKDKKQVKLTTIWKCFLNFNCYNFHSKIEEKIIKENQNECEKFIDLSMVKKWLLNKIIYYTSIKNFKYYDETTKSYITKNNASDHIMNNILDKNDWISSPIRLYFSQEYEHEESNGEGVPKIYIDISIKALQVEDDKILLV